MTGLTTQHGHRPNHGLVRMTDTQLPKLPDPEGYADPAYGAFAAFTADQMRAYLPAPQQATPEPVGEPWGWAVNSTLFRGEFAEADAKAEAKRCGGTTRAVALYTNPAPAASAEREARVIEQNARKAAQEQLYAERERHTAEVKRLQAEIGRLKAPAASVSDEQPVSNPDELPKGFVPLQREDGKLVYAACLDGGRYHGWLMWKHPDGQWVTKRKMTSLEVMQAEDQDHYGIVQDAHHGITAAPVTTLWCIHIPGPDELYAAPSKADAEHMAAKHNAAMATYYSSNEPNLEFAPSIESVQAVAIPWPHDTQSHADQMREFDWSGWGITDKGGA